MKRLKETENFFSLMNKCDSLFLFYLFNFVLDLRFDFRLLLRALAATLHLLQLCLDVVHGVGLRGGEHVGPGGPPVAAAGRQPSQVTLVGKREGRGRWYKCLRVIWTQ